MTRSALSSSQKQEMKILAIDLGKSKVGLAINYGMLAEPLEVIAREQLEQRLLELISEHTITAILIGLPSGIMESEVEKFIESFSRQISIPIFTADETLTSHQATLIKRNRPYAKRRLPDDAISAALILESWLELDEADE